MIKGHTLHSIRWLVCMHSGIAYLRWISGDINLHVITPGMTATETCLTHKMLSFPSSLTFLRCVKVSWPNLNCGGPQGSVIGQLSFCKYWKLDLYSLSCRSSAAITYFINHKIHLQKHKYPTQCDQGRRTDGLFQNQVTFLILFFLSTTFTLICSKA